MRFESLTAARRTVRVVLFSAVFFLTTGVVATAQQTGYEIVEVSYTIEGRTREFALRGVLDLEPGLRFESLESLVDFLDDQRQLLENERPLAESGIDFAVVGADEYLLAVRVDVHTVDSWNIIALPFLKYTSDDGLLLSIRARDYNFFGTLERVAGDVDWESPWPNGGLTEADRVDLIIRGALPFEWRGYDWRWDTSLSAAFIEGESNRYSIRNGLGISFPWLFGLDWMATYVQELDFRGENDADPFLLASGARLTTSVPTPWKLFDIGDIKYDPGASIRQPYGPGGISEPRAGTTASFDHQLAAGRINWYGNFREGIRTSLANNNSVNLYRALDGSDLKAGQSVIEFQLSSFGAYYRDSRIPVGVSSRVGSFLQLTSFSDAPFDISPRVRGIRAAGNASLAGDVGMFSNTDVYARAFRIERLVEGHVGLFLDIGFAELFGSEVNPDDVVFGSGIEVILFPLFSRALYLRASLGFDLRAAVEDTTGDDRRRELFIGIDHHY